MSNDETSEVTAKKIDLDVIYFLGAYHNGHCCGPRLVFRIYSDIENSRLLSFLTESKRYSAILK